MANTIEQFRNALPQVRNQLLKRHNVVATGIGFKYTQGKKTDQVSIVCSVEQKLPQAQLSSSDLIPKSIAGLPTDVIQTGPIRALSVHTQRHRPAPGGVSIGHRDITAGTLGCVVKKDGHPVILSNNHVLANSNSASIGDPILQPGPYDGGKLPDDHIANLEAFIPISLTGLPSECNIGNSAAGLLNIFAGLLGSKTRLQAIKAQAGENLVDAAIATPINEADVSTEILDIGAISGLAMGELGMEIQKSGRTTELTTGVIEQIDVTVNVQYGEGRIATFSDQLMAGAMSQGGDSGSAVLNSDKQLVGLLFAGSDQSTIINRIENVFSALDLTL